jgi:ubiquinone/menaquinone biosynthesis C-methylase UbiE
MSTSPEDRAAWLQANRKLRMDANTDLWDASRREFHLSRYRFAAQFAAGQDVLDAACGTGYGSALVAEQARSVTGVDIAADAVAYATSKYGHEHLRFVHSPVECTPFEDQTFSMIMSFETIEHTLSPQAALREFARLLKPDGTLILSAPNGWGYTEDHFFDVDQPMLERWLGERFESWSLYYNNPARPKRGINEPRIGELAALQDDKAECLIAICRGPKPQSPRTTREMDWMLEVYRNSMWRHRQFQRGWKALRNWPVLAKRWGWSEREPPGGA